MLSAFLLVSFFSTSPCQIFNFFASLLISLMIFILHLIHCDVSTLDKREESKIKNNFSNSLWKCYNPKKCLIGLRSPASLLISTLSGRQGRYAHAYSICAPFYCISLEENYLVGGGGYNAARGLISRDIAWTFYWLRKTRVFVFYAKLFSFIYRLTHCDPSTYDEREEAPCTNYCFGFMSYICDNHIQCL